MDEDQYLTLAKRIDAFRVIPRLVLLFYCAFFARAWFFIVEWFIGYDWTAVPKDTVVGSVAVVAIAGFPAMILGILTKVLYQILQLYSNSSLIQMKSEEMP